MSLLRVCCNLAADRNRPFLSLALKTVVFCIAAIRQNMSDFVLLQVRNHTQYSPTSDLCQEEDVCKLFVIVNENMARYIAILQGLKYTRAKMDIQ